MVDHFNGLKSIWRVHINSGQQKLWKLKAKFGWIPAPYAASLLAVLEKRSNFK